MFKSGRFKGITSVVFFLIACVIVWQYAANADNDATETVQVDNAALNKIAATNTSSEKITTEEEEAKTEPEDKNETAQGKTEKRITLAEFKKLPREKQSLGLFHQLTAEEQNLLGEEIQRLQEDFTALEPELREAGLTRDMSGNVYECIIEMNITPKEVKAFINSGLKGENLLKAVQEQANAKQNNL